MKYLFALLLLVGLTLPNQAAEPPASKKGAAKAEAKEPSAEALATSKTLTPLQKTKLLEILNKGDDEALRSLPGIGQVRAKSLVKARPFTDPVEIVKVGGIGDATLADIVAHAKAGFPVAEKKKEAPKKKAEGTDKKASKAG